MKDNLQLAQKNPFPKRKIAILGGTFDPIHNTHLHMAEVVREECHLDEVWFMPAYIPPHKQGNTISSGADRLAMISLAIESIPYFKLSTLEFEREGPSYTFETMRQLREQFPDDQFFFIIGGDMVESLPQWYKIEELVQLVTFIGVGRPEWDVPVQHAFSEHVLPVHILPSYISSTIIKERKRQGKSIRFLVPDPVFYYIEEKGLYD